MVGYIKNDSMKANEKLVAGCLSGALTRFLTQPMDIVKLRYQLQKKALPNPHKKWFKVTRRIYREEGLMAFWHGHNLGQIHSIATVTTQFYVYELCTKFVANTSMDRYANFTNFLCGIVAGCSSATLTAPLEVIRVRQMISKKQYKGILNGAKSVYKSGGILAFYDGWGASLIQIGPSVGISFGIFSFMQPLILSFFTKCDAKKCKHATVNEHRPQNLLFASTVAASSAGFVSKLLTYPFDLAKKRLQIKSHKPDDKYGSTSLNKDLAQCTNLLECLTTLYRDEGIRGLYRGWKVTIYKAQLTSVVAFTSYEMICYVFREVEAV